MSQDFHVKANSATSAILFRRSAISLALASVMVISGCCGSNEQVVSESLTVKRPNILFIMADDLGYSDIGALGGEIETPNLDALVADGRILTNHHSGSVSAVSRAMFISGTDHHLVGEGTMGPAFDAERKGQPGYEGYLNDSALSIAQMLKDNGYHTYIAGKWHLGGTDFMNITPVLGKSPDKWGFERSYVYLDGAQPNQFPHEPAGSEEFMEDGKHVQPSGWYSSDFYTDKMIEYIDSNRKSGKPFFGFVSYTAPHYPLQVPEPWLSKYKGKYDSGYESVAAARVARMKLLGIIPSSFVPFSGEPESLVRSTAKTSGAKYINRMVKNRIPPSVFQP